MVWNPRVELAFTFRPEMAAGGYARDDSAVEFYQRVLSVLPENANVLDLGAGRGLIFETDRGPWKNWLVRLGGRVVHRVGVDIDAAVLENPEMDEAKIIDPEQALPFPDQTFDIVLSDWVIEHVSNPAKYVSEIHRVLKIGGWFCARTPNKWAYFAIGSRFTPSSFEGRFLGLLQPSRKEHDVFPKCYKMNSLSALREHFNSGSWVNASYAYNPTPAYHGNRRWLFRLIAAWQSMMPRSLATVLLVFTQRIS
jgi:SAM-dependent methyltransferase